MEDNEITGLELDFAAIDKTIDRLILSPEEKRSGSSTGYIRWGTRNAFPDYLQELAEGVASLKSVIYGIVDYVTGDDVTVSPGPGWVPTAEQARAIIEASTYDLAKIGGLAWLVTRSNDRRGPAAIEPVPLRYLRADEDANIFWYSEKWNKGGLASSAVRYDKYNPENPEQEQGIVYVRKWGNGVYPTPLWSAALKACETERQIDSFHLGNLMRGFMGSVLVNFNGSGAKTDEQKREIEKDFTRKFGGARNGGRMAFSFNPNVANRTTIERVDVADFGDKYDRLEARVRQQIFTAFRANPNLFGIPTESNGFNAEEFESAFKLFNRTTVRPMQRTILDTFKAVLGGEYIQILPFTLDGGDTTVR